MLAELKHVSKNYGPNRAVRNISLQFDSGKVYGILGENGSGKSTLLKLLAGLAKPDTGEASVSGKRVSRKSAAEVSYQSELDYFYPSYTAEEMIAFHASQFPDFNREKAEEMLRIMGLERGKSIQDLSKGSRARLKLVLSLSRAAKLILLDEPLSGLDQLVRESIVTSLLSFIDFEKQTVIMATHEIDAVETLLDEVILLKDGEIAAQAAVEDLRAEFGQSVTWWMKGKLTQNL